jgi:hypothetical protein
MPIPQANRNAADGVPRIVQGENGKGGDGGGVAWLEETGMESPE